MPGHTACSRRLSNSSYISPGLSLTQSRTHSITLDNALALTPTSSKPNESEKTISDPSLPVEESLEARINRLGRERPPIFKSQWAEATFVFSICMSQLLTEFFVSGFPVILPTIIYDLNIPQASSVWPATAFSLVIASTLLVFGRLGDMLGSYPVFLCGMAWLVVWSVIAGFSANPLMLDFCRALQGLGAAAALPTGVGLMGSLYRPGPRKNFVFAVYGTFGIFGFFGGIFVAGFVGEFVRWGWYFWIGGILSAITLASSILSIVPESPETKAARKSVKMDYPGAVTIIVGLILTVFSITESAHAPQGWRTPYVPVCFALGIISLLAAAYIETRIAPDPILPAYIFTSTSSMTPLLIAIFLLYGNWGIYSVYGTQYFQNVMGASPLQLVAWYTPTGVAGLLLALLEGFILHLVPGRVLLVISGIGALGSQLLIAFVPIHYTGYWAFIFPAMVLATIGIDLSTILMTVFITTTFPASQQGLAGGVINSALQLGVAFVLGLTDVVQSATVSEIGLAKSYKNTFWFGVAAAAVSLVLMAGWGNVPKATSELTEHEKAELECEAKGVQPLPGVGSEAAATEKA